MRRDLDRWMKVGLVLATALARAQTAPVPVPPAPDAAGLVPDVGEAVPRPPEGAPATAPGAPRGTPLTLQELVQRARRQDARVEEAEAELRRLQALQRQAEWAWLPRFETTVGVGGPTPEARNDGLGGPPLTRASYENDLDFGRVGVTTFLESSAILPLYTFGKLSALEKAAEQGPIIGAALRARAQDEAAFQAAQAFFGYQLARSGLEQLEETSKRLDEARQRVEALLAEESPQVSRMDLYKVGFFRQQLEARRARAEQGRALALAAIGLLAGIAPGEAVEVAAMDLSAEGEVAPPRLEEALAVAEARRPELTGIAAGIAAREQEVLIRERSHYPDLGLAGFARLQYTTSATPQRAPFAYDPYNERTAGVGLVARATFDFPVKSAQVDQARAEVDKLKAQQRLLQAAIRLEVTKAHGELLAALERAGAFSRAERDARRWSTAALAAFDLGTGDTRELVDAFTALAQASAERAESWHDAQVARAALARATGSPPPGRE